MRRRHSQTRPTERNSTALQIESGPTCSTRTGVLCAVAVFLVALGLYCWTLAPTVTLIDSGELIVVARFCGVAHPPGTPLWTMLAHLASLLPWGNVAARINFSSAVFGAAAAAMMTLTVTELMIIASWTRQPKGAKRKAGVHLDVERFAKTGSYLVLIPAVGAGLLFAFSRTLWSYATITEVYTLNIFLILTVLYLMLCWHRRILAHRVGADTRAKDSELVHAITGYDYFLYAAALIFGLALGVHHVTVALTLPAIGLLVLKTEGPRFFLGKRLMFAALLAIFAFLAVYSYLPLAAARSPLINWGNPRSLQEIWWHITGRQYQVFLGFTPESLGLQLLQFCRMASREFGPPWIPATLLLALAGLVRLFRNDRAAFWLVIILIIADAAYALVYDIAEDKDAYYLPAFAAITIAAGCGIRWAVSQLPGPGSVAWKTGVAGVLAFLVSAIALAGNWPYDNRRHYFIAHDYMENLLRSIEPNGLLLTFDWQVASPMFYVQEIERVRPDAKIVDVNLLRRPWYFDFLRRTYPDLMERSREQVDPFLAELKAWERDPQLYERDRERNRRINTLFLEMVKALVANESRLAPIYATHDVFTSARQGDEVVNWLSRSYQPVPQGLVFRLTTDAAFLDSPDIRLDLRGLADGTHRFEPDDIVRTKVVPAYVTMLINRGIYLAEFDQHARAIPYFEQALLLEPDNSVARERLEASGRTLKR